MCVNEIGDRMAVECAALSLQVPLPECTPVLCVMSRYHQPSCHHDNGC